MGPAERPDSDRPLPAGELARPGFRRAGTCSDYRRLGSGRAAGLVQLTPRRRLAGGRADSAGSLSVDGVVSPDAVHQVATDQQPQLGVGLHLVHLPPGRSAITHDVADDLSRAAPKLPTR